MIDAIDAWRAKRPGRSSQQRYDELYATWRHRFVRRRWTWYIQTLLGLLIILVAVVHPEFRIAFPAGLILGGAMVMWVALPDWFVPSGIRGWQLGAWGEEKTASELRKLPRAWTVAHDVAWGEEWNHDHVLAGPSVYLLDSKNHPDSRVVLEDKGVRLAWLEDEDHTYLADKWIPLANAQARDLKKRLEKQLGFPVWVNPVVVVWGAFPPRIAVVGDVTLVHGLALVDWLKNRPADLLHEEKRLAVQRAVAGLPRATRRS